MRRMLLSLALVLQCGGVLADFNPASVLSIPGASTLTGGHYKQYRQLYLNAYGGGIASTADGGEGTLIQVTSCANDDGYCFHDADGTAFIRSNFNGDIRQYGVVTGSVYDCSSLTGVGASVCTGAKTKLDAMQTAALSVGMTHLNLNGVQIKIGTAFELSANMSLDGGGAPGARLGSWLINAPGTILLGDGVSFTMDARSSLTNTIFVPISLIQSYPSGPSNIVDLYTIQQQMVSKGNTAVICSGISCTLDHVGAYGFDTAFDLSVESSVTNTFADANVCFYLHDVGGSTSWAKNKCNQLVTIASYNQEYWTITGIAESASTPGICRLTINSTEVTGHGTTADLHTGYTAWVTNLDQTSGGATAYGRWTLTAIDATHYDLQGSACSGANLNGPTTTGTITNGSNQISALASMTNIQVGEQIYGVAGIVDGTYVKTVWARKNRVILSAAATATAVRTITFRGGAFTVSTTCDGQGHGTCLGLDAAARVTAGASAGGVAAGGIATAYLIKNVAGFTGSDLFGYGHDIVYHFNGVTISRVFSPASDSNGNTDDPNPIFTQFDGDSKTVQIIGGKTNKSGISFLVNSTDNHGCLVVVGTGSAVTSGHLVKFEVDDGCLLGMGEHSGSGYALIGNLAGRVSFTGYIPSMLIAYEGAAAQAATDTSGAFLQGGATWWGGQLTVGGAGVAPTVTGAGTAAAFAADSNDTVGTITAGTAPGTTITLTFANTWPHQPMCFMNDLTTNILITQTGSTTTSCTFATSAAPTVGDTLKYFSVGAND